jgi:hypothetical protein
LDAPSVQPTFQPPGQFLPRTTSKGNPPVTVEPGQHGPDVPLTPYKRESPARADDKAHQPQGSLDSAVLLDSSQASAEADPPAETRVFRQSLSAGFHTQVRALDEGHLVARRGFEDPGIVKGCERGNYTRAD